jgi:hypothetical protein
MQIRKYGRYWAVYDASGELVCIGGNRVNTFFVLVARSGDGIRYVSPREPLWREADSSGLSPVRGQALIWQDIRECDAVSGRIH